MHYFLVPPFVFFWTGVLYKKLRDGLRAKSKPVVIQAVKEFPERPLLANGLEQTRQGRKKELGGTEPHSKTMVKNVKSITLAKPQQGHEHKLPLVCRDVGLCYRLIGNGEVKHAGEKLYKAGPT